jgi:hypothetical protein
MHNLQVTPRKAWIRPVFDGIHRHLPVSYALTRTNGLVILDEQIISHFTSYGDARDWGENDLGLDVHCGEAIIVG